MHPWSCQLRAGTQENPSSCLPPPLRQGALRSLQNSNEQDFISTHVWPEQVALWERPWKKMTLKLPL